MHSEHYYIKQEDCEKINQTKQEGKRVIAVGTTSCRVLETVADEKTGMVNQQKEIRKYLFIQVINLNV